LDTDVPLLHEGYVFKDYGESSNCNHGQSELGGSHLPFVRHVRDKWYRFSDQPGF
jgi:hypothetical protein